MEINWSDSQKEVIYADDDRILVSASAGSGKTTVMIERILRLVKDGVRLSNMLICTFTKASAADMRAKLYAQMSKRGLKNELKDLSRADISTIDSFCQRIVTKYFYVLGIDPQFEVLDDTESRALISDAVEQSIEHFKADEHFSRLYEMLRNRTKSYHLKEAITSIMDFRSINPDTHPSYSYDAAEVQRQIDEYVESERQGLEDTIERLFAILDKPEFKAELLSAMQTGNCKWTQFKRNEDKTYKPCVDYLRSRVKDFVKEKEEIANLRPQSHSYELIEALIKAADYACEVYAAEKLKRSAVDFADLENMTLEILKSDVKTEICEKYKYVFVDEYQDINPLQESLIQRVAEDNKLFMVGDLKQSIYAFRGCAPDIFKQKYDLYKNGVGGRVINLDTNYRSAGGIIDFVNKVFCEVMTEDFGGVDYNGNPMSASKEEDGYVKFHLVTGKAEKNELGVYSVKEHNEPPGSKMEAEATLIAYRVQELLKQSHDGAPVAFNDIAILTRGMSSLEALVVQKLRQINVPVSLKEDAHYLNRPETGQLIAYLRLIDNRLDDKAMAMAMLSPLGGFSEDELSKIRLNGSGTFYECVESAAATDSKVKGFFDKLDRYYELSLTMSVDELADIIVSECGYFNYAFRLGEDAAEVLDKFLAFLGACPQKSSLKACLKFIDERKPYTELSGDDNSVKMMTIHKSKGLEFKYVFVIGLGGSFEFKDLTKHVFVDKEVSMKVYDNHEAYESDLQFVYKLHKRKKILEEELRIFYVAITRAKYGLELFASLSDEDVVIPAYEVQPCKMVDFYRCTSALDWLASRVFMAKKYDLNEIEVEDAPSRKVLFGQADEKLVKELKDYFDFSPQQNAPTKSYVSKLAHNDDEPAVYMFSEGEGDALERGNAYHRCMEALDFSHPSISLLPENDLKLVNADKLLIAAKKMTEFKGTVYKEKPFMIKLSALEAGLSGKGYVLVQGVIDLLVINGDEATIVDYKTGKAHGSFETGYFKQVNLYALAVERLLKKKVTKKYLYYFDAETFVEIE
ncbi:MAG: UvrD-helicase domain-containing protein [Clostridiales bacterium]|nr:UvrD-helicase domain-containing protein [Clostridiales bacterium]